MRCRVNCLVLSSCRQPFGILSGCLLSPLSAQGVSLEWLPNGSNSHAEGCYGFEVGCTNHCLTPWLDFLPLARGRACPVPAMTEATSNGDFGGNTAELLSFAFVILKILESYVGNAKKSSKGVV